MSYYDYKGGDNTPPNELPDELLEQYKETSEYQDWIMEEAGNGDWVVWEERNCSEIYDRACEYWNDQYEAAADDYADHKMERMRGND